MKKVIKRLSKLIHDFLIFRNNIPAKDFLASFYYSMDASKNDNIKIFILRELSKKCGVFLSYDDIRSIIKMNLFQNTSIRESEIKDDLYFKKFLFVQILKYSSASVKKIDDRYPYSMLNIVELILAHFTDVARKSYLSKENLFAKISLS